jgi:hypothetical protein
LELDQGVPRGPKFRRAGWPLLFAFSGQSVGYSYGLAIVTTGNWLMQNPQFSRAAGAFGSHPQSKIAIAVATTFEPAAFDPVSGAY